MVSKVVVGQIDVTLNRWLSKVCKFTADIYDISAKSRYELVCMSTLLTNSVCLCMDEFWKEYIHIHLDTHNL